MHFLLEAKARRTLFLASSCWWTRDQDSWFFTQATWVQFLGRELSHFSWLSLSEIIDAEARDFKVNCRSPQTAGWRLLPFSLPRELAYSHSLLCFLSKTHRAESRSIQWRSPSCVSLSPLLFLLFCLNYNSQHVPHPSSASSSASEKHAGNQSWAPAATTSKLLPAMLLFNCSVVSESWDPKDYSQPGSKFSCSFRFFCTFKILYL